MTNRLCGARFWFAAALTAIIGCGASEERTPDGEQQEWLANAFAAARSTYAEPALSYVEAAVDTLQAHHIVGSRFDWDELRLVTLERAEGAQAPEDTYDAIRSALGEIGDNHASFAPPAPEAEASPPPDRDNRVMQPPLATVKIRGDIAHLTVPSFWDPDGQGGGTYASKLHELIEEADASGVCGWIVDLRGNGGGNMWAMIAGLGPILGEGTVGTFVGREGTTGVWTYNDGRAKLDETILAEVGSPYEVHQTNTPVAVLTDSRTGSSGEAVAIAFRGRSNTRSFGEPTGGASTVPGYFELSDGAWLVFSIERMADREGTTYDDVIEPDEGTDRPVETATSWLKRRDQCGGIQ